MMQLSLFIKFIYTKEPCSEKLATKLVVLNFWCFVYNVERFKIHNAFLTKIAFAYNINIMFKIT